MFHTVRGDLYPLLLNIDDVKQKCPVTYNVNVTVNSILMSCL